ncbi:MAG: glycosyltransferase [Epsilonproteobacteria bacterium]|nr:glycosyltransferase [Campylobacterota bacterium]
MQQIILQEEGRLQKHDPLPVTPKSPFALIVHLYYPDLWPEIAEKVEALSETPDIYITVPPHVTDKEITTVLERTPEAVIYETENRGRDVLPFLKVMDHIGVETYPLICKLHSKKTGASPLGKVWRRLLYFDLIGSNETVEKIKQTFREDPTVGQVTGKHTVLEARLYAYGNNEAIRNLCDYAGIPFVSDYTFAGGTMFWSRPEIIAPVVELYRKGYLRFEKEAGQTDNTLGHAIERFFGLIAHAKERKILPSPADYAKLPPDLVEETASLVLSQQYAGEAIHTKIAEQIALIEAQQKRINELEELAESMRLKSRLKRLPQTVQKALKKLLKPDLLARFSPKKILKLLKKALTGGGLRKVLYYLKRGEVRYMLQKIRQKLKEDAKKESFTPVDFSQMFVQTPSTLAEIDRPIDIIIPVYDGYYYLKRLFDAIKAHTDLPYRLIVINDASPDERVLPYLKERLRAFDNALLLENPENLGFVKSVNKAVAKAQNHFVILNTDTEVPPGWLGRLMRPIVKEERVATTTPFTNAGTIASFPVFLEDNPIYLELDVATLDRAFAHVSPKQCAEVPTGVGFCMGVNYDLVKRIGFFDEATFGKGYGEENDWCRRAVAEGYTNLLVANLFVYHKHGGSFSSSLKEKLLNENYAKLVEKHPDYPALVDAYIQKDPHKHLREALRVVASSLKTPISVVFDHDLGGGANHYAQKQMEKPGANTLLIRYDFYRGRYLLWWRFGDESLRFAVSDFDQLTPLLARLTVGEVSVNNLVSYPDPLSLLKKLQSLAQTKGAKLRYLLHDYHAVCPSYTLLDHGGGYCGVPQDRQTCKKCLEANSLEWRNFLPKGYEPDIDEWRESWGAFLKACDEIVTFSHTSAAILTRAYPELPADNIAVIPHKVEDMPKITPPVSTGRPVTVGVLGAINQAKGAGVVRAMCEIIEKEKMPVRVVVIGQITEPLPKSVATITGRYKREDLPRLVEENGIDLFFIPSIWPETFSYTAEEVMQMGLPLMVFDLGAPAERVRHYDRGIVIAQTTARAALEAALAQTRAR